MVLKLLNTISLLTRSVMHYTQYVNIILTVWFTYVANTVHSLQIDFGQWDSFQ